MKDIVIEKEKGIKYVIFIDEWNDLTDIKYLNIILNSKKTSRNLGLVKIDGKSTSEKLKDIINSHLEKFGLKLEEIIGIVSDGASTMTKLGKVSMLFQILCFIHMLHLAVGKMISGSKN